MTITGNIIDIHNKQIFHGTITVSDGIIKSIVPVAGKSQQYLLPGFVDAHIHIESSMLVPSEFGATLDPADIETLMKNPEVLYLAEMMNYPGVLFADKMVMEKLAIAHRYGKPVDTE